MHDRLTVSGGEIPVAVDGDLSAPGDLIVLGHGAGTGLDSDFMVFFAEHLAAAGCVVARFNFLYLEAGRKVPDRQPVLEQTFEAVIDHLLETHTHGRLILGGKSMGGRIASHVATRRDVDGLVFLGYPLHPPGRPDRIRDAHLSDISAPMLFVEGTRDPFCPLETLEKVRESLPRSAVAVIEDGDHSLKVRKSSGRSTIEAWDEAVGRIVSWLSSIG